MVKQITFLERKPGLPVEAFQRHWRTRHAALVARLAGLQNHTLDSAYREREPDFDGVAEAWFDDEDALRAAAASPEYARTRADEPNFLAPGRLPFVIVREIEIALPGAGRR